MVAELEGNQAHLLPCKIEWEGESDKIPHYFIRNEEGAAHFRGRRLVCSEPLRPTDFQMDALLIECNDNPSSSKKYLPICKIAQINQWHHDEIDKQEAKRLQMTKAFIQFSSLLAKHSAP